ncbi:MAG: hypothetical protein JW804_01360 [Sedimentisphaerales bacterium]|nr:hypothetical protein [Sedimentisphaerales bacterium]
MKRQKAQIESFIILFFAISLASSYITEKSYACTNNPPVAILNSYPEPVKVNQEVLLDGSASYDPDSGDYIVRYEWDFTNNGSFDYYETSSIKPDGLFDGKTTHTYTIAGTYTCRLRVRDYKGPLYNNDYCTVTVIDNVHNVTKGKWYNEIQPAIDDANDGDEIVVLQGTYYEQIDFKGKAITLSSTDPNNTDVVSSTIINANNTSSGNEAVTFNTGEDSDSVISGFTLTGGWRGIYCGWQNPPSPTIDRCNITGNAYFGLWCGSGSLKVQRCRIYDNSYGGVHCSGAVNFKNCIITNNGDYGFYVNQPLPNIINCTVTGHKKYGIYKNCNSIKNCIIWDNQIEIYRCEPTYCCIKQPEPGQGNFSIEPLFVDAENGDYHLDIRSWCIDSGDPNSDYSNEPDGGGGRVNIGAYGNTNEATVRIDNDNDNIPDQWELTYWPDDEPNDYDPNDDTDGDGFTNRVEYLFGYNPNETTNAPMEIICPVNVRQIDPILGQIMSFEYYLNMDANTVVSFINTDEPSSIVRNIEQQATAGTANYVTFDGKDDNGYIVDQYFYDIRIDANDLNGHSAVWDSPDGVALFIISQTGKVYSGDFDPYKNIPVEITRDIYIWGKSGIRIVKHDDHDVIIYKGDFKKFTGPGTKSYFWYGRWDSAPNDPNYNKICTEEFDVWFLSAGTVDKGVILVYYDDFLTNLRCNPYQVIPTYDEVTTISYNLLADANVTIDITDPDGNYFTTLLDNVLQQAGHQEVVWHGTDTDPNDSNSRRISKEGIYMIEVYINGMDEKITGSITAYK